MTLTSHSFRRSHLAFAFPFLFCLLALPVEGLPDDMADSIEDGKGFAIGRNTDIKTIHETVVPDDLPRHEGTNVPEAAYYSNSAGMTNDADTKVLTDDNAQYIHGADASRRDYNINRATDPLLTHKPALETQATGLAATYSGCRTVQIPGGGAQICGSQLICPDGNCTAGIGRDMPTSTSGFQKAATYLALLQEMKDTFDPSTLEVFRGENKKCKDMNLGFYDCCNNPGNSQCNSMERELRIDRDVKRTHYVGRFKKCDIRALFFCILWRDYKSFCVFPSKLARIIVVQGRSQIGKVYGSARTPNCTGFTLDELGTVDFEPMDFSEFHDDVDAQAAAQTTPAVADAADDIKQKLSNRHQQIQ